MLSLVKWTEEEMAVLKKLQKAGGDARAKALPKKRRIEIATKAAEARWAKRDEEKAAS